jgi:hypothetical protein
VIEEDHRRATRTFPDDALGGGGGREERWPPGAVLVAARVREEVRVSPEIGSDKQQW